MPALDSRQLLGGGGINKHKNKEQKEVKKGKKKVQPYPKAAWGPVQALSLHRIQIPSTNHKDEDNSRTSHSNEDL
ncbi:hypothetical protein J6590_097074 [Homalodisca vitripennis]|nr:hypothetical protein J6590_097074 [Homalodisca vitripennis]